MMKPKAEITIHHAVSDDGTAIRYYVTTYGTEEETFFTMKSAEEFIQKRHIAYLLTFLKYSDSETIT